MKVLVVAPYLPFPADHGGRIRSQVLLRALAADHEVHLLAPLPPGANAPGAAPGLVLHDLPSASPCKPSPWRKLGRWMRGRSELLARRWLPQSSAAVASLLAAHRFDLLVADSSWVLPLLPEQPHRMPPLVLHLHNIEAAAFARRDPARPFAERLTRRCEAERIAAAEAAAAARARLVLTVSELDRQRLLQLVPHAAVHAIPNTVDVAALSQLPLRQERPPRLLFVGSYDYPPNADAARELVRHHLPLLRRQFPDLQLRLCGRDDGGALRGLAGDGVEIAGHVADLLPHYRDCDAVYLPIRDGGGTRIKVLEAFALGRPVLATTVAVEGLGVRDGAEYLTCEDPAAGARALRRVLDGEARPIVAAARQLVERRFAHAAAIAQLRALLAVPPAPLGGGNRLAAIARG